MFISASLRRILPVVGVVFLMAVAAHSQSSNGGIDTDPGDPGTGGVNSIDGKMYYPGGRIFDRRVEVRLKGVGSGDHSTFTDSNGAFTFRRLSAGTYYIVIDPGKEFQSVNETVDVISSSKMRSQTGQSFKIQINLQAATTSAVSAPRTVSAKGSAIPEEAATFYKEAVRLGQAGEKTKAIEALKKALSIYPDFMLALNEMGVQYLRLHQPDKAVEALRAALKVAPDAFTPRLNYGIALVRMKSYEPASDALKKAVDEDGSSAAARLYLGEALIGLGDYANAKLHLLKATALGGDDGVEAHRYLAAAMIETGEKLDAARELETYLQLNPKVKDADRINQVIHQLRGRGQN